MESFLGFSEPLPDVVEDKSLNLKLVPWISWDEWQWVKDSLFSSSPDSIASALKRISTWQSRGCTPVAIEVTASFVEIQQKDPFFRTDLNEGILQSEEMLAMLYCMAIMRLVNGVLEKTRKKNEISIGEAAAAIGIPRMLIDIRHEASHRDLPSLQLSRLASTKALEWLISYYWEPQEKIIPVQTSQTANLRKEIKHRLREVALFLKARKTKSDVKTKRLRQTEHLFGRNMFLSAGKSPSNSTGYKKQVTKSLKNVLRLYSSSSPEVVSVLLEFLLNTLDSSNLAEHLHNSQDHHHGENKQTAFDDWKSVVLKLSRKESEFLFTLTQAVLEKIEKKAMNSVSENHLSPESRMKHGQVESLSFLFEWLIRNLKQLNLVSENQGSPDEKYLTNSTLVGLLRRCLLIPPPSNNKHLMVSALSLTQLIGNETLFHKLKNLSFLQMSNIAENPVDSTNESRKEISICEAEEKFELIKCQIQSKNGKRKDNEVGNKRWVVAKSWNPCPIGMLPNSVGFSGRLPVLDWTDSEFREEVVITNGEHNRKREPEIAIQVLDNMAVKRVESEADDSLFDDGNDASENVEGGYMMIDGIWRRVGNEELLDIVSAVRLLV